MAAKAWTADLRGHYEDMARVWDKLAEERLAFFVDHPAPDHHGEAAMDRKAAANT